MDVTVCRLPTGAGRKPLHHGLYFESENMRQNKRCIIQINNANDVMCMARAVVVGKCQADKDESETWKKNWNHIRRSNKPLQIGKLSSYWTKPIFLMTQFVVLRNTRRYKMYWLQTT